MPTTPGRETVVTINTPVTVPMNGNWWQDLLLADISSGIEATNAGTIPPNGNYNVSFLSQVGWRLKQFQQTINYRHETLATDAGDVDPSGWASTNANTGLFAANAHIFPSWLTGIGATYGDYAVGPNDQYYMKYANAADSIAVLNADDQSAYPSANAPGVDTPFLTMDRVYTGTSPHYPDQDIYFYFWVPKATPFKSAQIILHEYFTGIPTYLVSDPQPGTGQYALTLYADGTGILQEAYGIGSWTIRLRLNWSHPHQVAGQMHVVSIRSDAYQDANGHWQGQLINFAFDNTNATGYIQEATQLAISLLSPSLPQTYKVVQIQPVQPTPQPIRLDVRRDIFIAARIQTALYMPTGYLVCKVVQCPFEPRDVYGDPNACSLEIEVFCTTPSDSSVNCAVYEYGSGSALPLLDNSPTPISKLFYFQCPLNDSTTETAFQTVITFTSTSDQTGSPTVQRATWTRAPISTTSTPTPLVVPIVSSISFSGADRDFTHETLTFTAPDLLGVLDPILMVQGGQTIKVDCKYDSNNPDLFSTFFQGRMIQAKRRQRGNIDNVTGYPRWGIYDCTATGEWSSLHKLKTFKVYNFAASQESAVQVTQAMTTILSDFYLPTQLDIPSLPQLFFTQDNNSNPLQIESYTPLDDLMATWARYYLGAYWVWDANYTNGGGPNDTNGCWRLIVPPSPPYNYVCQFLTARPSGTMGIAAENPQAWPTLYNYNPDGSNMVQTFCRKFSFASNVLPPEGNKVIVTGIGAYSSTGVGNIGWGGTGAVGSKNGEDVKMSQSIVNWRAANFGQNGGGDGHPLPDPTHPDYTDGIPNLIYYSDPALRTPASINYMARRIFDMACHTMYFEMLEAPYVLIFPQAGDPNWIRPRGLRFGDPVLFNGSPMFVWSAPSGKWGSGQDINQQAYYELRSIPALTAGYTASGTDEQYRSLGAQVN